MREASPLKETLRLSPYGEELASFYNTLRQRNPLQFRNIEQSLRLLIPSIQGLDVERTPEGRLRLQVKERGAWFSAHLISEGTLRVLGLLAVLLSHPPGTVVALEEPENGVHPSRLHLIADMLRSAARNRQLLLSTHSPTLAEILLEYSKDPEMPKPHFLKCQKREGATAIQPIPEGLFRSLDLQEATTDETETQSRREYAKLWSLIS